MRIDGVNFVTILIAGSNTPNRRAQDFALRWRFAIFPRWARKLFAAFGPPIFNPWHLDQRSMKQYLTAFSIFLSVLMMNSLFASDEFVRGVTFRLAEMRKSAISKVEYDLRLELQKTGPISASITIRFQFEDDANVPIVLDFNAPPAQIKACRFNGQDSSPKISQGHLVWPATIAASNEQRSTTPQEIQIDFVAGDQSLNRNDEFLYTLLVPDRASTVFPCFDQPDLKARFRLELDLPPDWIASANGKLIQQSEGRDNRTKVVFDQTKQISTYLFAFAAGEFQSITKTVDGRQMTMLHRESDEDKVARNLDAIFQTHAFSLDWLERYTNIDYQFDKFDFVLIPAFQYGGMEHIGNIFYNADQLLLDESATTNQKLGRASLIAHETAHMWFGNLVTMKWFDDVWLKEVFANFMAAKIVHPRFPDINHDLGFLLKHHPSAYGEDRSGGTYPIQQRLDNLRNAGTLYGRIIYQKAPIVMRQLETMIGQSTLQDGLREYLTAYQYDNAVWDDLIRILDKKTDVDLNSWSEAWVKEPGTPEIDSKLENAPAQKQVLTLRQTRTTPNDKFWSQQVDVKVVSEGKVVFETRTTIEGETSEIELPETVAEFDFYLANSSELGYGYFRLDPKSLAFLREHIQTIENDVTRGAAWISLYESLVRSSGKEDELTPIQFIRALENGISSESEPLNRQNLLSQLGTVFWKFLSPNERKIVAPGLESKLLSWLESDVSVDAKSAYFKSLVQIACTSETIGRLMSIWKQGESGIANLPLSENDLMQLALELAVRLPDECVNILNKQAERLKNEDRKKRFKFVRRALAVNQSERDDFFASLQKPENRRPERWVLDGLQYLHHPLRASSSEKFIRPSLELLEEIQTTGDIFFPKRWLVATFSGHRSREAAQVVRDFLAENPDYPKQLRNKILQAADLLFKASQLQ